MKGDTPAADIPKLATSLEASLHDCVVNLVVRQKENDMESVYLDIAKKDGVNKLLAKIREQDFTFGPQPSQDFVLREGQEVEMNLRGNVKFQGLTPPIHFIFHSYLNKARKQTFITEVDKFAQHGLDNYRGHVQFYAGKSEDGAKMLCELPITLPKASASILSSCVQFSYTSLRN